MVIDLVFQALLANLVETVELVEIDRVTVRHNETMKNNGHPPLLPEPGRTDFLRLPKHDRSFGDNDVLMVMRIQGIRNKDFDRAGGVSVQTIHQYCVEN